MVTPVSIQCLPACPIAQTAAGRTSSTDYVVDLIAEEPTRSDCTNLCPSSPPQLSTARDEGTESGEER